MWLSAWLLLCVPCLLSSPYYEREDHMLSLDDFDSLYADSVRLAQDTKEADEPAEKEPVEDAEGEEEGAEGDEEPAEGDEEKPEGDETAEGTDTATEKEATTEKEDTKEGGEDEEGTEEGDEGEDTGDETDDKKGEDEEGGAAEDDGTGAEKGGVWMKSIDAKTLDQLITEMNEMNRWFAKVVKYWDEFSNGGD